MSVSFVVSLLNLSFPLLLHDGWFVTSPADLGTRPGYLRTPLLWALGAGGVLVALHWTRLRATRRNWLDWAFILSVVWLLVTLALTSGDTAFLLPLRFVLGLGFMTFLRGWSRRRRGRAT